MTETGGIEGAPELATADERGEGDGPAPAAARAGGEPGGLLPTRTTATTAAATTPAATRTSSNLARRRTPRKPATPRFGPISRNSPSSGGTSSLWLMHPIIGPSGEMWVRQVTHAGQVIGVTGYRKSPALVLPTGTRRM